MKNEDFLKKINIFKYLTPEEKKSYIDEQDMVYKMYQLILENFIDERLEEIISDEAARKLDALLDSEAKPEEIEKFLRTHIPNFDREFEQAVLMFKKKKLLESVRNWQHFVNKKNEETTIEKLQLLKEIEQFLLQEDWQKAVEKYDAFLKIN